MHHMNWRACNMVLSNNLRSKKAVTSTLVFCLLTWIIQAWSSGSRAAEELWSEKSGSIGTVGELPSGQLSEAQLAKLTEIGGKLFTAKFNRLDGAGRPGATQAIIPTQQRQTPRNAFSRTSGPDSNACSSCHNDPVAGGAGDFVTNVFVSEGFALANFDSTDPQFSNERGTNHVFGAGLIELLAREMTSELQQQRRLALNAARKNSENTRVKLVAKGVQFGHLTARTDGIVELSELEGIDNDLVIRPFSQKGVIASLRQFTVNALNHHHGMQADERFGERWTGLSDFDGDGKSNELSSGDISALVAWQATRPAPKQVFAGDPRWQTLAAQGSKTFDKLGCSSCHIKALPLKSLKFHDPGPFDSAGTLSGNQVAKAAVYDLAQYQWAKSLPVNDRGEILVPLFGDLKRHKMTDNSVDALGNELLSQRFVDRNVFMTAELWGAGSTAPYGHRNDFSTLHEIIAAHGGEARGARDAYLALNQEEQTSLIALLRSLVILP